MARNRRRNYRDRERSYRGNVDAYVAQLRRIGEHVVDAAKREIEKGANDVATDAKSLCPVRTGKLRNSIHVEDVADGAAYEIIADAKNDKGIGYGQFAEYAPWGKPFMLPALEANSDRIRNSVRQAIQDAARRGY